MTVEITPRGTRGWEPPRPLLGATTRLQVRLYHRFGDRMRVQGRPVLLLTTRGAKTGKVRQTVLCWFPDPDSDHSEGDTDDTADGDTSWLVVASAASAAKHPAWYVNLARHPDHAAIEIGGRQVKVEPESLRGAERAAAWRQVVAQAPGYAAYQEKTDREIPIVRLRAVGPVA
jgi:deazaflavin-dependent oxidoreductase (nitroreductase family)